MLNAPLARALQTHQTEMRDVFVVDMLSDPVPARRLPHGQIDPMHLQNQARCWAQLSEGAITPKARRWLQNSAVAKGLDRADADEAIEHVLAGRTMKARQDRYIGSLLVTL